MPNAIAKYQGKQRMWRWAVIALCVALVVAIAGMLVLNMSLGKRATNYTECKNAGGIVTQSYPEQCAINGKTFSNDDANTDTATPTDYIGLSEQAALNKAKNENKPARVVERDGEALPVTMDYAKGRLNLTITNGKVEKVGVEGS